jgi:hypothetical protein
LIWINRVADRDQNWKDPFGKRGAPGKGGAPRATHPKGAYSAVFSFHSMAPQMEQLSGTKRAHSGDMIQ